MSAVARDRTRKVLNRGTALLCFELHHGEGEGSHASAIPTSMIASARKSSVLMKRKLSCGSRTHANTMRNEPARTMKSVARFTAIAIADRDRSARAQPQSLLQSSWE